MDLYALIEAAVQQRLDTQSSPVCLSISGAQGSGKTTLATRLRTHFTAKGLATVAFSIDDLYLTRSERTVRAQQVHPLLATRGVPGTHDLGLGFQLLEKLHRAEPTTVTHLPAFDKSRDDRVPDQAWPHVQGSPRLIICEGWCMGAQPQSAEALAAPINRLEADRDPSGRLRTWVNRQLRGPYRSWFARFPLQLFLAAPGFEVVCDWRTEQEQQLAQQSHKGTAVMNRDQIQRFIQHYERLTRHMLNTMPQTAGMTLYLKKDRTPDRLTIRGVRPQ